MNPGQFSRDWPLFDGTLMRVIMTAGIVIVFLLVGCMTTNTYTATGKSRIDRSSWDQTYKDREIVFEGSKIFDNRGITDNSESTPTQNKTGD